MPLAAEMRLTTYVSIQAATFDIGGCCCDADCPT